MSKETGLIPDSPFNAFIRRIRNLGTKALNLFFTDSPKELSFENGSSFPKDGDFDQALHFDFISEIFRYTTPEIKTLHDFDLNKSLDELMNVGPNKYESVELTSGGRLDGVIQKHNKALHRKENVLRRNDIAKDNTASSPYDFDNSGFKNKIRPETKKYRKNEGYKQITNDDEISN